MKKSNDFIQLSDLIAGTIRKLRSGDFEAYSDRIEELISNHKLILRVWPDHYNERWTETINEKQDFLVAEGAISAAEDYIRLNPVNEENKAKHLILEYLIFNAKFLMKEGYIHRWELVS